ncbi:polysaccharide biosynthesis/export family protein [Mucilaginibacter litoreus]|uniref:Polysaccharide biosynthesis/export family protein n=1 Tax=Mucilaginibacter litoreus TaxID=1048221 RepID=A0ABW3AV65_9SPHI
MNKHLKWNTSRILTFLSLVFLLAASSCKINKNIQYFKDLPDSTNVLNNINLNSADFTNPVVQTDDILNISIQTIDPTNSSIVNQAPSSLSIGASSASSIGTQQVTGYLVDKDGYIEMPLLGKLKVVGLTTFQVRELIRENASKYLKSPSVQVRFANFKITVIGEVARPATYTLPNEKVSVLDAIGLAGDLTIYGKRENILLIREADGHKQFTRFNLNSSNIFKSPYYYLKQNDVLYIEPSKEKIATTDAVRNRNITIGASLLSALLVILIRVVK